VPTKKQRFTRFDSPPASRNDATPRHRETQRAGVSDGPAIGYDCPVVLRLVLLVLPAASADPPIAPDAPVVEPPPAADASITARIRPSPSACAP
jgi:hypothetical protein